MWTGTSTLQQLDQTLLTIRNDVVRLDAQLSSLTQSMGNSQRRRVRLLKDIAEVRLNEIDSDDLRQHLNAADLQAADILSQRESAQQTLNTEIDQQNSAIHDAEGDRATLLEKVNATSERIATLEVEIQANLKQDKTYLAQFQQAQRADSIAEEAASKAEQSQHNVAEKAVPYQQDKLFMYLWERGFGTAEYKANPFTRMIDSWVAGVIKFEPARVNYWNLNEIPTRLLQHAQRVENTAEEQAMAVQTLELNALKDAGVPEVEQTLDGLRDTLDELDDALEAKESKLNTSLDERGRYLAGDDDYMQRSVQRLMQALEHKDLYQIQRYVRETVSPNDDLLVSELHSVLDSLEDVVDDLNDVRTLHSSSVSKLKEMETVRRQFKNQRFDDIRSGFSNEALINSVLRQFVQGAVNGGHLWNVLRRNQRYRNMGNMGSLPDFGSGGLGGGLGGLEDLLGGVLSGGLGRPTSRRRRSTWHRPRPRSGRPGGFRFPGRRSGGGGGFRTGGGF